MSTSSNNAVVLLSGGLDSATALAMAVERGFNCYVLSFDYGQRSQTELAAAKKIAANLEVKEHRVVRLNLEDFGGSALTDESIDVPDHEEEGIPVTYVPARNTVFMSLALAWAEVLHAQHIFIGVNAVDYSGYPDCRPEYIAAFENMANLATKTGVEGERLTIETPLIDLTKAQIIQEGTRLGVDYGLTVSCYQADDDGRACGVCDSCRLRAKGFEDAGVVDPTRYVLGA
ncbi:7-cyano-7-deazaguanine synthase QueC [Amphritea sp. 2_MG-2023]|jgi:7-cyano-7-deazaguanine synthase|uniref:7-cyano-7-deazaguanine synthase QueC n=1 Tax=Amphritea TaxID=515417 RepID=UPI001C06A63E|nr:MULTISPECIES: 7-cyano-7-deazaguanine synthase QueC [Amphritea]MBU2966466.1 7-cyano-7-deazaguanine synthase QueC [Amphritea atlantica]MDO6417675.1 7-cyano-7-deazaguanine synthase QueC [Amphritea sp. 2_MG-2023]MDX2422995.1 7-cyano-7-deazaguanine synthase QueC [Amphritea sp.]